MNKEQSLELYNRGKEAWNAWARDLLARQDSSPEWKAESRADFSSHTFEDDNFSGFIFPDGVDFSNAVFMDEIWFIETEFDGVAEFVNAVFEDRLSFIKAEFRDGALFNRSIFKDDASFWRLYI